jgi:dsDNA-binding SOS-regulon protein
LRFSKKNDLSAKDYYDLMMDNIDEVAAKRVAALRSIKKEKLRVCRAHNKRVLPKNFQIGNLVCEFCNGHLVGKGRSESKGSYLATHICWIQ